ncbi:MAG: hypothetical protein QOH88_1547 [Verrucomicrobiota bacterium]|jgi:uncharacterized protein YndB with AHSA1/START domain
MLSKSCFTCIVAIAVAIDPSLAADQTEKIPPMHSNAGNVIKAIAVLKCTPAEAFRQFTDAKLLGTWLGDRAEVEPKLGGKYEIFWKSPPAPPNRGTTGCRITVFVPEKLLGFDWIGPTMFDAPMNVADPATHVLVSFIPRPDGTTEVHLIHTGWGHSPEWDKARLWFERAWNGALTGLAANFKD